MVVHDVLSMMDDETKKASERASGSFIPTFLRLGAGQKARIRPLFKLDQCVVLAMHSKFNQSNPADSINAVCSTEVGGECPYCEAAKNGEKGLGATTVFMLPVYVSVIEQRGEGDIWTPVTYKKDDKEIEVSGLRILELKAFGTVATIMQTVRGLHKEDEEHDIRRYGLIIERIGAGQQTKYAILPKGPSAMPEAAKNLIPTDRKSVV